MVPYFPINFLLIPLTPAFFLSYTFSIIDNLNAGEENVKNTYDDLPSGRFTTQAQESVVFGQPADKALLAGVDRLRVETGVCRLNELSESFKERSAAADR